MVGFLFGSGTGETADSLARKRKMIEAMQSQIMGGSPRNANEGIGALIKGIATGVGNFRLGQQEKAGTDAATSRFNEIAKSFFKRDGGDTITTPVVSNELSKSAPTENAGMEGGNVYNDFIAEVKKGGLTNPYGLAAVAATGRAESGYDPKKVNASWSDPSQSGQPGMSGGIMSWRGPRLQAMREFAQANGEDPTNISPAMQARFLAQEDPTLFQSLNNAKSVEEAQNLINNAWKFAGYDGPSKESARRLGYAQEYLPSFQGVETASLDPSVGMPAAVDANAQKDNSWLRYANSGATRSQPISDDLQGALSFLPEMGVQMEVFSGGQPGKGESGARTGSTRHDHGGAADVFFYKDGRRLDWRNPDDVPIFQEIVRRGKANGITGFGAGDNYMQPGSMHIGFGAPAVWGSGGKGANAAEWLRTAYASAGQPTTGQQAIASIMADQPTELAPIQATAEMQPDDAWAGLRSPFVPKDIRQALVDRSGFVPGGTAQGEGMERARRGNPNSPFIPRDLRAEQPQQVQQPATTGQTTGDVGQFSLAELYDLAGRKFLPEELRPAVQSMINIRLQEMQSQREEQQWRARQEYQRQQEQSDPMYQLKLRAAQQEAEQGKRQPLINAGSGSIYDPNTKEWISAPETQATGGDFRFAGNSVEAQALNGLMESGQLMPDQAQQIAAGKTITGPNGEIIFMTPQGITARMPNGQTQNLTGGQPAGGIDIFGDAPQTGNVVTPTADTSRGNGMITLTEPKVTIDEKKAMTFADRMRASGKIISGHGAVGASIKDAVASQLPFGVGNFAVSDEYQSVDQARRDFINAQLRRESGAVIAQEEFDNANKQYFPQPGDTEEVIKQKERNRQLVIDGMARDAGPTYGSDAGAEDPLGIR